MDSVSHRGAGHKPGRNGELATNLATGRVAELTSEDSVPQHAEPLSRDSWDDPIQFPEFRVRPFPVKSLPDWLARWVDAEAEATQTPPDLPAMLALAVCGSALAKKFRVLARAGWTEPTNIYAVVVLPPGNRKSAVFADAVAPLKEFERAELERMAPNIAEAQSRRRTMENRLKAAEQRAAKAKADGDRQKAEGEAKQLARDLATLSVPAPPRYFADDVTPEQLAVLMAEQDGRLLIASAEGTICEIALGRYSERPNFEILLKGHAGDDVRVDRVGRKPDIIEQPALSIALTVQPDVLTGLASNASLRGRGLLARNLYSIPHSLLGHRKVAPAPVPEAVTDGYRRNILAMFQLPGAVDETGRPAPHLIKLSDPAEAVLRDFERELEPQLGEGGALEHIADWAGKLAGAAVRLAGIVHAAEQIGHGKPCSGPVSGETMRRAVVIARDYLLPHAQAAFGVMGADPEIDLAKGILRWIERHGNATFTRADLYQHLRRRVERVEELDPPLARLEQHNYIRRQPQKNRPGPGRPVPVVFEANPATRTRNSGNSRNSTPQGNFLNSVNSMYGGAAQNPHGGEVVL